MDRKKSSEKRATITTMAATATAVAAQKKNALLPNDASATELESLW